MKTLLAAIVVTGFAAAPAIACSFDKMAQSERPVEMAASMSTPQDIDNAPTASITREEKPQVIAPEAKVQQ